MSRYLAILAVLAVSGITACSPDNPQENPPAEGGEVSVAARVSAGVAENAVNMVWSQENDVIGLAAVGQETTYASNLPYTPNSSSVYAKFSAVQPLKWQGEPMDLYAYTPYSADVTDFRSIAVSVPAEQDVVAGVADMRAVVMSGVSRVSEEKEEITFTLRPFASLLKLSVTAASDVVIRSLKVTAEEGDVLAFGDGTLDVTSGKVSVKDGGACALFLKLSETLTLSTEPTVFYAWVAQGRPASGKVSVSAVVDDNEVVLGECELPEDGFLAGQIAELSVRYDNPADDGGEDDPQLSETVNLSASGTSNTYIVTSPSKSYCFDATVKGNGTARSFSWTVDGVSVSKGYSDVGITPASAGVLWYASPKAASGYVTDSPIVVNTVRYQDGKIYFETPETFVNGNAVIAAYDASDNIVWSWTIWAAENYDADASAGKVGRYTVMDRNLGAFAGKETSSVSDALQAAYAIGNYYQWGRKDPFPAQVDYNSATSIPWGLPAFTPVESLQQSANGYDNVIFTSDQADNAVMLGTALGASFAVDRAVEESVKYPHKWMFNGTSGGAAPYVWAVGNLTAQSDAQQTEWRYLWGSVDGNTSLKTIYDPCPPGWKVPTADVWMEVMAGVTLASGTHGVCPEYFDMYIPLAGQKKAGNSKFGGVNAVYLASATVTGPWYPTRGDMVYYNGQLVPTSYGGKVSHYDSYAGQGLQVRCVKETVAASAGPFATGSRTYDAVLMGDSITEQWPVRGRSAFFTENNYLCKGISGQTTMDMVARFTRDVIDNRPKVVVITAGTNDLAANDGFHVSSEDILNNVSLMARVAEDYGAKVIIGSVCPSRDFWWKTGDLYKGDVIANRIVEHNRKLKEWAQSKGYRYADYHTALKNSQNDLADEYCWDRGSSGLDRVHPNAAGYTVMEGVLKPLIDAALNE